MKSFTGQGKKTVVLDTNIIVSALIAREGAPARVFELLILGRIENYTSPEIIRELKEVLYREEIMSRTAKKGREFVLRQYLNRSIQVSAKTKVHAAGHAADNKFLEVALEGRAKYVITGDSHLLSLHEFRGIKIIRAKEFLEK
ncbi:MAG: putative toxin-antitoxin system toxin component, PIN family [archaeon]